MGHSRGLHIRDIIQHAHGAVLLPPSLEDCNRVVHDRGLVSVDPIVYARVAVPTPVRGWHVVGCAVGSLGDAFRIRHTLLLAVIAGAKMGQTLANQCFALVDQVTESRGYLRTVDYDDVADGSATKDDDTDRVANWKWAVRGSYNERCADWRGHPYLERGWLAAVVPEVPRLGLDLWRGPGTGIGRSSGLGHAVHTAVAVRRADRSGRTATLLDRGGGRDSRVGELREQQAQHDEGHEAPADERYEVV